MTLVPRILEFLGIENTSEFIRIECFGGTTKDLQLLARLASAPLLGTDRGTYVELDRPLTHFLVLTDAENKYATAAKRRLQRRLLLDSITYSVPKDLRADYYSRSAHVVEIRTWGKLPFEFADFCDRDLAKVLLAVAGHPYPTGEAALERNVGAERRSASPNIADIWHSIHLSKVAFADAAWPLLERRIQAAATRGTRGPPIMANVLRARKRALRYYQSNVVLTRRKWRPPRRQIDIRPRAQHRASERDRRPRDQTIERPRPAPPCRA